MAERKHSHGVNIVCCLLGIVDLFCCAYFEFEGVFMDVHAGVCGTNSLKITINIFLEEKRNVLHFHFHIYLF